MITLRLARRGQVGLAREIEKLLRFLDRSVESVSAVDTMTLGITLAPGAPAEFEAEIPRIVLDYVGGYKDFRPIVVATSEHKTECCICPHELDYVEVADGVRSKEGDTYAVHRFLIATFNRLYRRFAPRRMTSPSMIERSLVERMGYFKKFPNLANFVFNFEKDYDLIRNISDGTLSLESALQEHVEPSDKMLNPVPCYHVYPRARGLIARTGKTAFALDGTAYRYESHNMSRLRLNECHIQEIVFFGSKAEVLEKRAILMQDFIALYNRWQLDFEAETSCDVFYSADAGSYMATQRYEHAKIELNGKTDTGYHAITSFNFHGTHYTKLFDIDVPGSDEPCSACVGQGIERVLNVLFSQFGDRPEGWPSTIRDDFLAFREAEG